MAENFCLGATRGDWKASAEAAGYKNIPDEENETIWQAIQAHGADAFEDIDTDDIAALAKRGRKYLLNLIEAGAKGAPAAAVALMRLEKAEKAVEEPGVAIIPTIGTRDNMWYCPKCLEQYDEEVWRLYTLMIHERIQESDRWHELKGILLE